MAKDRGISPDSSTEPNTDQLSTAADYDSATPETSQPFLGRWNRLVSQTNWEKGRIILDWRDAMIEADSDATEYSDEAWARIVGGVTGQHVGRLRRVYQRFGDSHARFEGLFWSHFFAASEWDDAEMWLEGAVQNDWSVSRMRRVRWETLGAVATEQPDDEDIVHAELDEDYEPAQQASPADRETSENRAATASAADEELDVAVADRSDDDEEPGDDDADAEYQDEEPRAAREKHQPFADLPDLPDDLADAFEVFKLAILSHRATEWRDVSPEDVVRALQALQQFALAPLA